jgi:hypothetical protein
MCAPRVICRRTLGFLAFQVTTRQHRPTNILLFIEVKVVSYPQSTFSLHIGTTGSSRGTSAGCSTDITITWIDHPRDTHPDTRSFLPTYRSDQGRSRRRASTSSSPSESHSSHRHGRRHVRRRLDLVRLLVILHVLAEESAANTAPPGPRYTLRPALCGGQFVEPGQVHVGGV